MKTIKKFQLILIALFVFVNVSEAQGKGKMLEKRITIPAGEIRIDSLLQLFIRETGLEFSFNSNKIPPSKKVTVTRANQSVSSWLSILKKKLEITHKFVGNHIILIDSKKKPAGPAKSKSVSVTVKAPPGSEVQGGVLSSASQTDSQRMSSISLQPQTGSKTTTGILPLSQDSISTGEKKEKDRPADSIAKVNTPVITKDPASRYSTENEEAEVSDPDLESFQLNIGYSKHGSGDMKGVVFGGQYMKDLSFRFSVGISLAGSIHSSRDLILVNNQTTGQSIDASVRFTTAGVQLGPIAQWHMIKSARHDVALGLGLFGRYQSASNGSDGYSTYPSATTGVPTVLVGYQNSTPQHTVAFGGLLQLGYSFSLGQSTFLGVFAGFQTDTNGDALPQAGITLGRRFGR